MVKGAKPKNLVLKKAEPSHQDDSLNDLELFDSLESTNIPLKLTPTQKKMAIIKSTPKKIKATEENEYNEDDSTDGELISSSNLVLEQTEDDSTKRDNVNSKECKKEKDEPELIKELLKSPEKTKDDEILKKVAKKRKSPEISKPETNAPVTESASNPSKKKKFSKIITTSDANDCKDFLNQLVMNPPFNDVKINDDLTTKTSHIVSGGKRTVKVLLGICRGLWIVSPEWVLSSISGGKWQPEKDFELLEKFPGCKRSRISHDNKEPKLFDGKKVYIHGKTKIEADELENFIHHAGGDVVPLEECNICITNRDIPKKANDEVRFFTEDWLLDSIAKYSLLEDVEYELKE